MSDKIIHTFQERRIVGEAVSALANTSSEAELEEAVQRIAQNHAPALVLPALRRNLNAASSQMRGGLGRLAALLPRRETVALLRKEAGRRDSPAQIRLNAAMILERFLEEVVPVGLMGDLQDPNIIVMQSLQEALEEGRSNPHVLLEYVRQMREESQDVAFLVMDLLGQLAEEDQPELLRVIAYDSRPAVAEAALARLGALREPAAAARSASALHALQSTLHADRAEAAARQLRKLRLAGVRWQPAPAEDWWALASACDFRGGQHLWFLRSGNGEDGAFIGLRVNRAAGILEAFGSDKVDSRNLPPRRREGDPLSIAIAPGETAIFQNVPYSYARHCLQLCLESHLQEPARALPEEFILYNPFIFQHGADAISQELSALLSSGPELWSQGVDDLSNVTSSLLGHPTMAGWTFPMQGRPGDVRGEPDAGMRREAPAETNRPPARLLPDALEKLARSLLEEAVPQSFGEQLRQALLAQAEWLHIAGHDSFARHAVCTAESLRHLPLHNHPLMMQLIALGLHERQGQGNAAG